MKAYKGFNRDMTCRGFQYKEGAEYEEKKAQLCHSGFHACEDPMDCFSYYSPSKSVYHEVDLEDICSERESTDTKVCAKRIKIGARLNLSSLVKATIEYVQTKVTATTGYRAHSATTGYRAHSATTGDGAHSATTGDWAHSATTGDRAHSATTGDRAHSATTGDWAHSATTGYRAHSATTGDRAHSATTGDGAHSATTGDWAHSATTGYRAHSATTGDGAHSATTGDWAHSATTGDRAHSATTGDGAHSATTGKNSIAAALGIAGKAKGSIGCWLVLAEYAHTPRGLMLIGVKCAKVDGSNILADTWYHLRNGKFEISKEDDE